MLKFRTYYPINVVLTIFLNVIKNSIRYKFLFCAGDTHLFLDCVCMAWFPLNKWILGVLFFSEQRRNFYNENQWGSVSFPNELPMALWTPFESCYNLKLIKKFLVDVLKKCSMSLRLYAKSYIYVLLTRLSFVTMELFAKKHIHNYIHNAAYFPI